MKALFRLDADGTIGLGHLMRCLVLADALSEKGVNCAFACRPDGHWLERKITRAGHEFCAVGSPERPLSLHDDAIVCAELARRLGGAGRSVVLLVVDHYRLGAAWESAAGAHADRVLVIDDLADREHRCDFLLDSGPGRAAADYEALVPADCQIMAGERFVLVRDEIVAARACSLARRQAAGFSLGRILITMGGADAGNDSTALLVLLDDESLPGDISIDVVLGASCPWAETVREASESTRRSVRVLVDTDDMGNVMAGCDLAIGASGGSALERCVLGLPAIALITAENQRHAARSLEERGAVLLAHSREEVRRLLVDCLSPDDGARTLARMSEAATAVCDGRGKHRVIARLLAERALPRDFHPMSPVEPEMSFP